MMNGNINDMNPEMNGTVSIYGQTTDEFPVLKAFQQYIDNEQAKARKRMMLMCIFFSFVLTIVIGVFVALLVAANSRNQALNDKLVDYAMNNRERPDAVTKPQQDENNALKAITGELDKIRAALSKDRNRPEIKSETPAVKVDNRPSAESLEIERLKALLAVEREKAAVEREKLRQAELEEYRRRHYPELYEKKQPAVSSANRRSKEDVQREADEADKEIEAILKDIQPIDYFDDDEEEEVPRSKKVRKVRESEPLSEVKSAEEVKHVEEVKPVKKDDVAPSKDDVAVPNSVKDLSGNSWGIPLE